jgi:putative ABC transport system permease protein
MSFYLAFKELWRNRGRFLLISLVIALITVLVLFVAALAEGLAIANKEYIEKLDADLIVFQKSAELSTLSSRIGRSTLNDIRRVDGVVAAGPIGFSSAAIALGGGNELDIALIGVEPGQPGEIPALRGRGLRSRRASEAVIDSRVALRANLNVGDEFVVRSVQGTEDKFYTLRVVGISDGRQYFFQPSVVVPYLTWNKIKPQAVITSDNAQSELVSNVVGVRIADPTRLTEMAQRIEASVRDTQAVDRKTAYEAAPGYSAQQSTLVTQRAFAMLIGTLVIGGFFQIQILQKVAQIGVLKAIGASNPTIALASVVQITAVTAIGVAIGTAGTLGLSLSFPPTIPILFTQDALILAIASLMLIGPIGGMVSVLYSLRIEPLTALGLSS